MKKVIFLFLFCTTIFTSLELITLNPVFAKSNQDSSDLPINSKPPSADKPSGIAEKGKPILDRNLVVCPQVLKEHNDSNKNVENVNTLASEGKGQVPSSCLHQAK